MARNCFLHAFIAVLQEVCGVWFGNITKGHSNGGLAQVLAARVKQCVAVGCSNTYSNGIEIFTCLLDAKLRS